MSKKPKIQRRKNNSVWNLTAATPVVTIQSPVARALRVENSAGTWMSDEALPNCSMDCNASWTGTQLQMSGWPCRWALFLVSKFVRGSSFQI
jgi:hypothetical protein